MNNKIITIIIITLTITLTGCINNTIKEEIIDIPINTIGLTLNNLSGEYEILYENYINEPYQVEQGLILEGWYVQEKYEVIFNGEYNIAQTIAKFDSKKKCEELMEVIKNNYSEEFTLLPNITIGDSTFFGENKTMYSNDTSIYLLCFTVKNIAVILFGTSPSHNNFITYANTIEKNIIEKTKEKEP